MAQGKFSNLEVRQYEFSKRVLEFWKEKDELEKLRKIQTMKAELKQMMHSLEIDQLKLSASRKWKQTVFWLLIALDHPDSGKEGLNLIGFRPCMHVHSGVKGRDNGSLHMSVCCD